VREDRAVVALEELSGLALDVVDDISDQTADYCSECGDVLGARYTTSDDGTALCLTCAGVNAAEGF